ncbi:hypothetical protein GGE67_005463 [Rhizobium leucaenae]|nr:hypothetical protein [Rhizobium leucaenae]
MKPDIIQMVGSIALHRRRMPILELRRPIMPSASKALLSHEKRQAFEQAMAKQHIAAFSLEVVESTLSRVRIGEIRLVPLMPHLSKNSQFEHGDGGVIHEFERSDFRQPLLIDHIFAEAGNLIDRKVQRIEEQATGGGVRAAASRLRQE